MNAVPERKDTNPKDAVGTGKVPFTTIPTEVLAELGLVMLEGARKYGRHNYRAAGVRASVYIDAAMRHLVRFWEGEDTDPDSGMPHLIHVMACMSVLRDSQVYGNWTDDRPPKLPDGWLADLNERAKAIVEKYPDPVPAFTEQDEADKRLLQRISDSAHLVGGVLFPSIHPVNLDESESGS